MAKLTKKQENVSAVVGLLIVILVALLAFNAGMALANFLREPTWHSPKGCPIYVGGTNGK